MTSHTTVERQPWLELTVLRKKDGHTKTTFARAADISLSYLSQLENGVRTPNEAIIKRFADTLRVPVSVLEPQRDFEIATPEDITLDILATLHKLRAAQQEDTTRGDAA